MACDLSVTPLAPAAFGSCEEPPKGRERKPSCTFEEGVRMAAAARDGAKGLHVPVGNSWRA